MDISETSPTMLPSPPPPSLILPLNGRAATGRTTTRTAGGGTGETGEEGAVITATVAAGAGAVVAGATGGILTRVVPSGIRAGGMGIMDIRIMVKSTTTARLLAYII